MLKQLKVSIAIAAAALVAAPLGQAARLPGAPPPPPPPAAEDDGLVDTGIAIDDCEVNPC